MISQRLSALYRSVRMSSWDFSLWNDSVHSGVGLLARSKVGSSARQQCPHAAISLSPLSHNHDYLGKSWSSTAIGKCGDFTAKSTQLSSLHWQRSGLLYYILGTVFSVKKWINPDLIRLLKSAAHWERRSERRSGAAPLRSRSARWAPLSRFSWSAKESGALKIKWAQKCSQVKIPFQTFY